MFSFEAASRYQEIPIQNAFFTAKIDLIKPMELTKAETDKQKILNWLAPGSARTGRKTKENRWPSPIPGWGHFYRSVILPPHTVGKI